MLKREATMLRLLLSEKAMPSAFVDICDVMWDSSGIQVRPSEHIDTPAPRPNTGLNLGMVRTGHRCEGLPGGRSIVQSLYICSVSGVL